MRCEIIRFMSTPLFISSLNQSNVSGGKVKILTVFHFVGTGLGLVLAQLKQGITSARTGFRKFQAVGWLFLGCAMVFCQSQAQAQFGPIPLTGGPLVKMVSDYQRPYIYAIQAPALGATNGNLLFINITNNSIDKTLLIGTNPTDLTINVAEARLYIASWGESATYEVNLTNKILLPSLNLGTDVSRVKAIKAGRIFTEGQSSPPNYIFYFNFADTIGGTNIYPPNTYAFATGYEGDGEVDPTGSFYYHCTHGGTPIFLNKNAIANDTLGQVAYVYHQNFGARNLVLSHDGTRVFWNGDVFDTNLTDLGSFGAEIYACSANGTVAFGSSQVFDTVTLLPMYNLPVQSTVMRADGYGQRLWYYDSVTNTIESIPLATMESPTVVQQPVNQTVVSGHNAVITVGAAGLEPLTYNWCFNGTNFATTTNGQITILSAQGTNAGNYTVLVTNAFGSVVSSNAVLTVQFVAPVITSQPVGSLQPVGTSASFFINASGSLPIYYRIFRVFRG